MADRVIAGEIFLDGKSIGKQRATVSVKPGVHEISFGPVAGFNTPKPMMVNLNANRQLVAVYLSYTAVPTPPPPPPTGTGYLKVYLLYDWKPQFPIPSPDMIYVDGVWKNVSFWNARKETGYTYSWYCTIPVPSGAHSLSFVPSSSGREPTIRYYHAPATQSVSVGVNQIVRVDVLYRAK